MVEIGRSGMRRVFDEGVSIFIICEDVTSHESAIEVGNPPVAQVVHKWKSSTELDEASVEDMLEKIVSGRLGNSR